MLFDGLDEIFNISEKNEVRNDIIIFTNSNKVRTIVTSRFKGYEDAKFDEHYLEFEMMDFNDDQINEYIYKWYTFEEDNEVVRKNEIEEFKKAKSALSRELIENPLLLSLIVILYRNNLRLPESKLEIYQSCTKTLVDKWDSIKELDITINKDILKRKETILADLAFWQYETLSDNPDQLTFSTALEAVSNSIADRLRIKDDWVYTKSIAEPFMEYLEKRSIYFDNNFTHKTFLEYFTAFWIYSNCDKKHFIDKRDEIIDKYINNPFWYIVFELLLNMIDDHQSDEEIIDGIYNRQILSGSHTYEFLLSALPSMQHISTELIKSFFSKILVYLSKKAIEYRSSKMLNNEKKLYTNRLQSGVFDYFSQIASSNKFTYTLSESVIQLIDEASTIAEKI